MAARNVKFVMDTHLIPTYIGLYFMYIIPDFETSSVV
jgi:hypothetical protein